MHRRRRVEGRQGAPVFGIVRAAVGTIAETRCRLGVKEWSCIGCAAETRHGPAGGVTVAPGRDGSPERPGTEQGGTPVTPNRAWSDPSPSNPIPRTPSGIITLGRASSASPTSAPTRVRDLVSGHRFRPRGARTATPPTGPSAAAQASGASPWWPQALRAARTTASPTGIREPSVCGAGRPVGVVFSSHAVDAAVVEI